MKIFRRQVYVALALSAVLPIFVSAQNNPTVRLETNYGNIFIELFQTEAPATVDNFLAYVNDGFYDGLLFHRVIEDFMIQAGSYYVYDSNFYERSADPPIVNESYNGLSNLRGTVAMARTTEPNSATSQFFINHIDNLFLDRQNSSDGFGYCVFGKVIKGLDVVDAIATSTVVNYYPQYSNDPFNEIPYPFIGMYVARTASTILMTKFTVTASSKINSDNISFSGTMDATVEDFNDVNAVKVTIDSNDMVNPCVQSFPVNANTFKKGKYSCSGTDGSIRKSFTYNPNTGKFAFAASKVDLSGLDCPATVEIQIGDFFALAQIDETIANGTKKPMPILLMTGVRDVLMVDKCTVKQNNKKINSDQLSVKGAFAVDDINANMVSEDLVITLGAQQFTIPASQLKSGNGKLTCSKANVTQGGIATATFNFNSCSFILTINNANIDAISGNVDFGVAFADYNEVEQVTLP